jgi:hypothetical protein
LTADDEEGVILDAEFFAWLEANAAVLARDAKAVRHGGARCWRLKAGLVENVDLRAILG